MGKKNIAPQRQKVNIGEILKDRLKDYEIDITPCLISSRKKTNEEKDYIIELTYRGDDLWDELDHILIIAKEEVETPQYRAYLHACRKIYVSEGEKKPLKGLKLYYRLRSLKNNRR